MQMNDLCILMGLFLSWGCAEWLTVRFRRAFGTLLKVPEVLLVGKCWTSSSSQHISERNIIIIFIKWGRKSTILFENIAIF
jgi:hypothetical protein